MYVCARVSGRERERERERGEGGFRKKGFVWVGESVPRGQVSLHTAVQQLSVEPK